MKVPKVIAKPNYIFGLPEVDFYMLVGYFMVMMFLNNIAISSGVPIHYWGWLFTIFSTWGVYIFFKWAARQNQPGYLLAMIAHKFMQAKKINAGGYKIKVIRKKNGK